MRRDAITYFIYQILFVLEKKVSAQQEKYVCSYFQCVNGRFGFWNLIGQHCKTIHVHIVLWTQKVSMDVFCLIVWPLTSDGWGDVFYLLLKKIKIANQKFHVPKNVETSKFKNNFKFQPLFSNMKYEIWFSKLKK